MPSQALDCSHQRVHQLLVRVQVFRQPHYCFRHLLRYPPRVQQHSQTPQPDHHQQQTSTLIPALLPLELQYVRRPNPRSKFPRDRIARALEPSGLLTIRHSRPSNSLDHNLFLHCLLTLIQHRCCPEPAPSRTQRDRRLRCTCRRLKERYIWTLYFINSDTDVFFIAPKSPAFSSNSPSEPRSQSSIQ